MFILCVLKGGMVLGYRAEGTDAYALFQTAVPAETLF